MDIKAKATELVEKIKKDPALLKQFKENPVKIVEELIGMDLPDDQIKMVADAVKAKIDLDKAANLLVADESEVRGETFFELLSYAPFAVLAGGTAFFLCLRSEERNHQFAGLGQRVDVLLFKVNTDAHAPKVTYYREQCDRVAGKAADGLGDDPVDQAVLAVLDQLHEARAVVLCTGIGFICVDAGEDPIGVALDVFVVVADLGSQRMLHGVLITGNTCICRNPQQFSFSQLHRLNQLNGAFHSRYPLS